MNFDINNAERKAGCLQIKILLGCLILLFVSCSFAQFNTAPDFYAVEVEGAGPLLRRRLLRVNGQSGAAEVVSGTTSVEGEPEPSEPLFPNSVFSWDGSGSANFIAENEIFTFDPPRGEPTLLGSSFIPTNITQLFSINPNLHLFTELESLASGSPPRLRRINLADNGAVTTVSFMTGLQSFDPNTYTIINAQQLEHGVLLKRQSVIDDSSQNLAYWEENRFRLANLVLPYAQDEVLVRVETSGSNGQGVFRVTQFWRWPYLKGEVILHRAFEAEPGDSGPNPFQDKLSNVIGFTGDHYVIPPPTQQFGTNDPYILLVDKQTLEPVAAIPTLFPWDSHYLGRIFFSDPSLIELEPGKFYTGLIARVFSPDYSSSTDTVFYIKQADAPIFTDRGTGPDLPPFVGMSVDRFDPNPAKIFYLGADSVIEIDTATGNRTKVSDVPNRRFIVGSGSAVAPR